MVATVPQQHSTAVLSAPYIAKHHTYRPCSPNRPSWFLGSHAPLFVLSVPSERACVRGHLFWRNHQPTTLIFNKDPHHHHHHHNTTEEEEDRADNNTPSPPPLAARFVVGRRRPLHPRCMLLSATCSALKCFATLWQLYITVLRGVHSSKY